MIITDGLINDMNKTIDEIVRGSGLPLAIIIVGVGEADFGGMDILDADDEALYSNAYRKKESQAKKIRKFIWQKSPGSRKMKKYSY